MTTQITVDIVIFTIRQKQLEVLLVKRRNQPFQGKWALPGGFVHEDEALDTAARRELKEETGVDKVYLEQLYSFGALQRDPRGRVITVAYFALVDATTLSVHGASDASDAQWFAMSALPPLAFDHHDILHYALKRLRWKVGYTTVAFSLLPSSFTLTELQQVYEIIFTKKLDKRNFRKKIIALGIITPLREKQQEVSHRPAQLYTLSRQIGEMVEIF